jgi:hypothetical protein
VRPLAGAGRGEVRALAGPWASAGASVGLLSVGLLDAWRHPFCGRRRAVSARPRWPRVGGRLSPRCGAVGPPHTACSGHHCGARRRRMTRPHPALPGPASRWREEGSLRELRPGSDVGRGGWCGGSRGEAAAPMGAALLTSATRSSQSQATLVPRWRRTTAAGRWSRRGFRVRRTGIRVGCSCCPAGRDAD